MPKPSRPPTARLRRLASQLLALRTKARLSREDVTEQTGINAATLYRIETAKARPQARTLKALLDLYGVESEKREALTSLLREASQQSWLQPYHEGLPAEYNTYMSFEAEAQELWMYGMTLIPGILQAEGYARYVVRGMLPQATADEVERRVDARMKRQAILDRDDPLHVWAIVDEAALRRQVGSTEDMRAQLVHLQEAMQRPDITLQVLPFDAGPHPAMLGSFVILRFGEPVAPDIVYIEGLSKDLFLDDEASIIRYTNTFEYLRAGAASPPATERLLADLAREL